MKTHKIKAIESIFCYLQEIDWESEIDTGLKAEDKEKILSEIHMQLKPIERHLQTKANEFDPY